MKLRHEEWGAWVKLHSPPSLVALDHDGVLALGVRPPAPPISRGANGTAPLEVHVSVTNRCPMGCATCYTSATPDAVDVPMEQLRRTVRVLADVGVFTVALGGGEPLVRDDLEELAAYCRELGLTPVVTTSGLGLTPARASRLAVFEQVNVSHDGAGTGYQLVRGFPGAPMSERAIDLLVASGVRVGVNLVVTQHNYGSLVESARGFARLGARELQLIRLKPGGRGVTGYDANKLTCEQVDGLADRIGEILRDSGLSVRIDCAMLPLLSRDARFHPEALRRFGVFGCEAGRHLAGVDGSGDLRACSVAKSSGVSVANLGRTRRAERMIMPKAEPCFSCPIREVCRGGCGIVAAHYGNENGPDPECPRTR